MSTIENIVKSLAYATEHNQGLHLTHEEVPALLNHLEGLESDLQGYEKWTDNHYQVQIKEGFKRLCFHAMLLGEQLRAVYELLDAAMQDKPEVK
jgi:hypothetical protein